MTLSALRTEPASTSKAHFAISDLEHLDCASVFGVTAVCGCMLRALQHKHRGPFPVWTYRMHSLQMFVLKIIACVNLFWGTC